MAQKYNWDTYTNDTDLWKEKRMGQDKGNREILMLYLKKKKTTEGNESWYLLILKVNIIDVHLVQSLSRVWLFVTPWTAARQNSLSIINSRSLFKLISIESVMSSNHLILCHPLLLPPSIFPSIRPFPMSQFFTSGGQSIGVSASASVLLMNIQDWSPLGWGGSTSLQSKGLSRVFSNTTLQKHQFFSAQLSL